MLHIPTPIFRHILRLFTLSMLLILPLVSCDKVDDNGDFGGFWRFEDASAPESAHDAVLPAPQSLTWGVRCEVIQVRRLFGATDEKSGAIYYFTFVRTSDVLQLTEAFRSDGSHDFPVSFSEFPEDMAIPDDGRLLIRKLSRSTLIVEGKDSVVMRFRKL